MKNNWELELTEDNSICANAGRNHSVIIQYECSENGVASRPKVTQRCCKCGARYKVWGVVLG